MTTDEHSAIATLFPGYFALVMATGIIAIGAYQQNLHLVANVLFAIALVGFVVLAVLTVARLIRYPRLLIRDLTQHSTGFSFLTTVAALNVLGSGAAIMHGWWTLAWATATFWFPVMIAIGVWRHVIKRVPLRYNPAYWALVFPIGMYGVATYRMIAVTGYDDLDAWPKLALAMALVAWVAAFAGLLADLVATAVPARSTG